MNDRAHGSQTPPYTFRLVLDMGGTRVRTALVDGSGVIQARTRTSAESARAIRTREEMRDLIVDRVLLAPPDQRTFVLSLAGPISWDNRIIRKYTNVLPDEFDIPISDMVEEEMARRTGKAVRFHVIKDAVASSLAEMGPAGAAAGRPEVIALILGTGTGGAPCRREADGRVSFPDALADIGHHQVDPADTEPCSCGSQGCVELETSGTGVARLFNRTSLAAPGYGDSLLHKVRRVPAGSIDARDIGWAARQGDAFTLDLLRKPARALALLLKNVFTSHPGITVVLVGGFALGVGAPLVDLVRQALMEIALPFIKKAELAPYVDSRVLLGMVPADDTNLVGARMFLCQAGGG
jgi:glucokinase